MATYPASLLPMELTTDRQVPASTLPMQLSTDKVVPASTLPMRLASLTLSPAVTLPMVLEAPDPAHFTAAGATWGALVVLGGVDVSASIAGPVSIDHEEMASGRCELVFSPAAGAIDPEQYENQPLQVSFLGLDGSGAEIYRARRFTGVVEVAIYDPDQGRMTIHATTDLQGRLEGMSRDVIAGVVGGLYSEHIFDDTADGYQYALDRLSTQPAEIHIDNYGQLVVVPWAAKAVADVEFTDANRFDDTLNFDRVQRRDLVTRFTVNLDFRYVRLRHREMNVSWINQLGLCHYLDNNWKLASKDMVRSAADGTEWTRLSDIAWVELPPTGTYCTPPRGWAGGATTFALGASWKAARRWAQTLTEQYQLVLVAPDLAESVGNQVLSEDYGIEATYDATDFEQIKDFEGAPGGAVLSAETQDWTLEATASETDGRAAMAAAQACVLAKGRVEILGRARGNRLTFSPSYRPDITLATTARVNTPGLVGKGKVRRIQEAMDPTTGELSMELGLAISRHGGSGLAVDDPLTAAPQPVAPAEDATPRTYTLGYRIGSTAFSPAEDPDWDGYVANVASNGALYDANGPVYRERFTVTMPEIEAAARDATAVQQAQTYQVAVPQDELTMSA